MITRPRGDRSPLGRVIGERPRGLAGFKSGNGPWNGKVPPAFLSFRNLTNNEASAVQVPQVGLIDERSVLRYASEGLKAKMGRMGGAQRVNEKSPVRAI